MGVSGTAKSTASVYLSKHVKQKSRRFVVSLKPYKTATPIELDDSIFERFSTKHKSTLVLDDLNKPTEKTAKIIRRLLVETSRHLNVRVIIIVHSINNNNITQFLPHIATFLIAGHVNNRLIFEEFIRAAHLNKDAARAKWQEFAPSAKFGQFLVLDPCQQFTILDMLGRQTSKKGSEKQQDENEQRKIRIRSRTTDIVTSLDEDPKIKIALMNYIFHSLSYDIVSEEDLSIDVASKRERVKASLPDVLFYVTTKTNARVPDNVFKVIQFIFKKVSVPRLFVQNQSLKID